MFRIRLQFVFWLHFGILSNCGHCCGPAEIGQRYTITSTRNVPPHVKVIWQLGHGVTLYDSSLSVVNSYPDSYVGTKTELTILRVTKKDGIGVFHHLVNGPIAYSCKLPVYKIASTPTCETVTLIGNKIRTVCTTAQVYPQAKCHFTLQNGGTDGRFITDGASYITYTHTYPQPGGNEYYSTSCSLQYPVNGLKPGNWTVQVNMYPDQTDVSLSHGTIGQANSTLQLSVPTVNIDPNNCPKELSGEGNISVRQGYIRQGEQASCKCTRAHAGNPPGTIGWSSIQGGNFDMLSQSEDVATIQINSPDNFTCRSISELDGSHSVTYTPKYAYGPSSASLTFQRPGPIYLCPNQQTNIDITCQVPENNFHPATMFTIVDDNSNILVTKVAGDDSWYKSVNYNFTKSGQHTFRCRGENAVFGDISIEAPPSTIQVFAPPNSPPSFKVTGQHVSTDNLETWVKRESEITVSCLVGDAYPRPNSVNVTCGQDTSSSGQLSVSGVRGDELTCQCAVDHETKGPCNGLNLTNEITIKTAYGPNQVIVSFADNQLKELPNDPLDMCSSEVLELIVICAVKQSDVRPGMNLNDFRLNKPNGVITLETYLDSSDGDYKSVNKLKINSGGNHRLVCEARNPKVRDIQQSQTVTIEARIIFVSFAQTEPPSTIPVVSAWSRQNGDILIYGDDVTIKCLVYGGYPSVQSVTLTCGHNQSVTSYETSAELTLYKIRPSNNSINCACQATHVTGCYDLTGALPLNILSVNPNAADEDTGPFTTVELAGGIVGAIVGTLVLEAFIAVVVFVVRREKRKRRNRTEDTEYDKIKRQAPLPYQNVKPRDTTYQETDSSDQAPNSASVNQETDRTYRNQAYGDYEEPIELDTNAYSDIQTD